MIKESPLPRPKGRPRGSGQKLRTIVAVRLGPAQRERLRELSAREDLPQSILIRLALERSLKEAGL